MDFAIVDLQGFKDNNNRFIVKEFYLQSRNMKFHDIIKSPIGYKNKLNSTQQKSVEWLTKNFHGISWEDGFITLKELRSALRVYLDQTRIYMKGEEKIIWIKHIMKNDDLICVNLEDFDCDINLNDIRNKQDFVCCENHSHITPGKFAQCAVANVKAIHNWNEMN